MRYRVPGSGSSIELRAILKREKKLRLLILLFSFAVGSMAIGREGMPSGLVGDKPQPTQATPTSEEVVGLPTDNPSGLPCEVGNFAVSSCAEPSHGTIIFETRSGGHSRLFAYTLGYARPVPLTEAGQESSAPAISPDGRSMVFSSRRSGSWDLYLLDLQTGEERQITETPGFEGHPTWSPDSHWLAYEAYYTDNLDVWIIAVDGGQAPVQLTSDPSADMSPAWDPAARRIAFVSDRDGSLDVFLADLDKPTEPFKNLTKTDQLEESSPSFSPDGKRLVYGARMSGVWRLLALDTEDLDLPPVEIGQGRDPSWSPDGGALVAILDLGLKSYVVVYPMAETAELAPSLPNNTRVRSAVWSAIDLTEPVLQRADALEDERPLWKWKDPVVDAETGRLQLVDLPDVEGPKPVLSDAADEAFNALRKRVAEELGWDLLSRLEHSFVGLTDPLPPGYSAQDWLYTARAFSLSSVPLGSGWMELMRDDFGARTYWHVYVRTLRQDGSAGEPLRDRPWDLSARYHADPNAYDVGGAYKEKIPSGYFVDFTCLAADYGFERLPALSNWRTFYRGARHDEFAYKEGLSWYEAMLQIYPASAIPVP